MHIKDIVDRIAIQNEPIAFSVKYWDGDQRQYGNGTSTFAVSFNDESTCRDLFSNISLRLGEAYESGAIDVDGDFQTFLSLLYSVTLADLSLNPADKCKVLLTAWRQRNTRRGVRRNVRRHYDLGNDFYRMWLGEGMHYSCAYFRDMSDDITLAQTQKCEHICRKLHLRPGDTLLDVGCGWGAFAIYAARHFGARVVGITLSTEQQREHQQKGDFQRAGRRHPEEQRVVPECREGAEAGKGEDRHRQPLKQAPPRHLGVYHAIHGVPPVSRAFHAMKGPEDILDLLLWLGFSRWLHPIAEHSDTNGSRGGSDPARA